MRTKFKWHSRILRSKQKAIDALKEAEFKEDLVTTSSDSGLSNSSVIETTYIQHYAQSPSEVGHSSVMGGLSPDDAAVSRVETSPGRDKVDAHTLIEESFECIYCEGGKEVEIDSRDDGPSFLGDTVLRGDIQSIACRCSSTGRGNQLPHLPPSKWPQAPLLLRPQPNGGTRVLGIRKESTPDEFLWRPGQLEPWWQVLQRQWSQSGQSAPIRDKDTQKANDDEGTNGMPQCCEYCVILPINNGCEKQGESLVVDFESALFKGTLLFRLREAHGTTKDPYQDNTGYFAGKVIRYQAVLRGCFKSALPFSEMTTGTRLERPCGKLPPKWVMWTAMKVIHFFAPQLQTQLEKTDKPLVLSPLGSAPRTIVIEDGMKDQKNPNGCHLSKEYVEPTDAARSILGIANPVEDGLERARARRKLMDQWAMAKRALPSTQTDKIYTFEFLQHLFDYQNFTIELGNSFHVSVKDMLNGQPLQIMAEHRREGGEEFNVNNKLWSFQIWNECLWNDAMENLNSANSKTKNGR